MKNIEFKILGNKLRIDNYELDFPYKIKQVEAIRYLLIVMVDIPFKTTYNRNVFAVNARCEIQWQIEESPHGGTRDKPYSAIIHDGSGGLVAETFIGINYQVNLANGAVIAKSFNRF